MVRRKITLAERWQAVGMSQASFNNRGMAGKIDRLMQRLEATGMVDERPRYSRRRKTAPIEDKLIARCARRNRFPTPVRIRDALNFGGHVSVNEQRLCTRWHIKRSQLSFRHRRARWNIRNWKRVHLSEESIFLRPVDGRVRHRNTTFHDRPILITWKVRGWLEVIM